MWKTGPLLTCLLILFTPSFGDYYSSLLNVEKLIDIEDKIVRDVEKFIESTEELMKQAERALDIWEKIHERDIAHLDEFVKDQTNGFKVIKRNTVDLDLMISKYLRPIIENGNWIDIFKDPELINSLPKEKDLYEISWSLAKLSMVYNITFTSLLIHGELGYGGKKSYHNPLTAEEVILFFQQLYSNRFNVDHFFSKEFYSLILGSMQEISLTTTEESSRAVESFTKLMWLLINGGKVSPHYLETIIDKVIPMFSERLDLLEIKDKIVTRIHEVSFKNQTRAEKYKILCQGQGERSVQLLSKLRCYYKQYSKNYFLLIAPLKVEELNLEPQILLFHDILNENEMEALKAVAIPKLERSKVKYNTHSSSEPKVSNTRLTHQSSFWPNKSQIIEQVAERTKEVTGFSREGFEEFSINIYGIGGYYLYHSDSNNEEDTMRAATMLYYLSDVQLGGSTIFPSFNLTVQARKGTAILWYNTHTAGGVDYRMAHSACPVLLGHKWIGTQLIRHLPQMFHRPCVPGEVLTTQEVYMENHVVIPELQQQ